MIGFFSSSVVQKTPPRGTIARCGSCGLFRDCASPKLPAQGEGKRGVLIIGECPGREDDERGKLFQGRAGAYLREALDEIGCDLDQDAWSTAALICHTHGKFPDSKQISFCHPNLTQTIRHLRPRVLVPLGRAALVSTLSGLWEDVSSHDRWTGWQIPHERHWICPTFHPSLLVRESTPALERLFKQQLAAAFAIEQAPPPQPDWDQLIEVELDDQRAAKRIDEIREQGGWVAVDYETKCIKPEWPRGYIASCAVSNGKQTVSYPWVGEAIAATGRLLRDDGSFKIASNLKMEERWTLHTFGHGVRNWGWDTMLATHCLDNRTGICSLKFQSFVRLGVPPYNKHIEPYLESHQGPYNRIEQIDLHQLLFYGGMDAILEHRLARKQRKDMGHDTPGSR